MNSIPSTPTFTLPPTTTTITTPPSPSTQMQTTPPPPSPLPSETLILPWQPRLSTAFSAPASCFSSLTMLQARSDEIWFDEPVPADQVTLSACYDPMFMTSYLQSIQGNTALPPFSPLVCPQEWWTVTYVEADWTGCSWATDAYVTGCYYVACCPSNYCFEPVLSAPYTRIACGGTCTSLIANTTVVVQYYDETTYVSDRTIVASDQPPYMYAHAHPIDGYALNPPPISTPAPGSSQLNLKTFIPAMVCSAIGAGCLALICFFPVRKWYQRLKRRRQAELERMRRRIHSPVSGDVYEGVSSGTAVSGHELAALDVEDWRRGIRRE